MKNDKAEVVFEMLEEIVIDSITNNEMVRKKFIERISDPSYKIRKWEERACNELFNRAL